MAEERTKNQIGPQPPEADTIGGKRVYEQSTIEFPYNDLDNAVEVAKAVHSNAGVSCTLDQLAAYLDQAMSGGAFRSRVSNAGTFRLTKNAAGTVELTELGRRIVDPAKEMAARVESFLEVPLYKAIFEKYRGYTLPPPSALERELMALGVAQKQTDKARQAFMRSARQAGFFAHGDDRLVRPAGPGTKPLVPTPYGSASGKKEELHDHGNGGGGSGAGGGGGSGISDPLIRALLQKLPEKGPWAKAERDTWMKMLGMAFDLAYGPAGAGEPN